MTFHILGIILPFDELIFFRGVGIPPISNVWRIDFASVTPVKCLRFFFCEIK